MKKNNKTNNNSQFSKKPDQPTDLSGKTMPGELLPPEKVNISGRIHLSGKQKLLAMVTVIFGVVCIGVSALYFQQYYTNQKNVEAMNKLIVETDKQVEERKFNQAIARWQVFLKRKLSPELSCQANIKYADVLLQSGLYKQSNAVLQKTEERCPESSQYSLALGLAKSYEGYGELTKAIANYEEVIAIEKNWQANPPKDFNKAQSEKNVANYTEIIKVLQANL